jgi:hypothetical protein
MHEDDDAIFGQREVHLDAVRPHGKGSFESQQGVLWIRIAIPSVGLNDRRVALCEHRGHQRSEHYNE